MADTDTKREDEIDQRANDMFNTHPDLKEREHSGTDQNTYAQARADQTEAFANDPRNATKQAEEQWHTNVSSKSGKDNKKSSSKLKLLKRGGPLGLILMVLGVGGLSIFGPTTMLVNLVSNLTERYDYQNTSMSIRSQRVLAKRLAGSDLTKGQCRTVKIACRYSRPSNKLLKSMADNGFTAYDKKGNPIPKRLTGFPNAKPAKYVYESSAGKTTEIKAKDLKSVIKKSPEISRALAGAYRARYMGFSDKVAYKIFQKWGINKMNKLSKAPTDDDARKRLNAESSPDKDGRPNNETVKKAIDTELKTQAERAKKVVIKSRTNGLLLTIGVACLAKDTPRLISKIVRTYQLRYLIRYGMVFLSAADALKAGDATAEQVGAMGTILTAVSMSGSKVTNKSALDSFGIKYALFGDTSTKGYTKNYKDFIPGGGSTLSSIGGTVDSPKIQKLCNEAMSPSGLIVANAIEGGFIGATGGTGAIPIGIAKGIIGAATTLGGIELAIKAFNKSGITGFIARFMGKYVNDMLSGIVEDWTKDIKGEDVGNALTASMGAISGQVASAGGNMPLTQKQALAYNGLTSQVIAREADYDRSTLSPFDASNPHTFMGTIATKLLPSYNNFSSVSGTMANVLSIPSLLSSFFGTNAFASNDTQKYSMCQDSNVQENDVAADPFCNIEYGIPTQYLDEDPVDVLNSVKDQIDPDTGKPLNGKKGEDLRDWISECTNGEIFQSASCVIVDKQHAEYALYLTDSRIIDAMDNPLPGFNGATQQASTGQGDAFTVGTYNLQNYRYKGGPGYDPSDVKRMEGEANVIKQNSVAIVGLQEAKAPMLKDLLKNLPGWDSTGDAEGSTVAWDTSQFTKQAQGFFQITRSNGPGKMVWTKLASKTTQSSFYIFDVHLSTKRSEIPVGARQTVAEIKKVVGSSGTPVVLTGDMNSNYTKDPLAYNIYKNLLDEAFFKTTARTNANCDTAQANHATQDCRSGIGSHIDQILISKNSNLTVTSWKNDATPTTLDLSDHNPVFVGLSTPSSSSDSQSTGEVTWPLDKKWWLNNKADFLNAHISQTGTAWGTDNMGTNGKGAGIASDIGVPIGTPVYAMVGGKVTSTNLCGSQDGIAIKSNIGGKALGIAYMHGNQQKFKVGDTVKAGDLIMKSGVYGCRVFGAHLHIGMAYGGKYICPQDVFLALGANKTPNFASLVSKGKPTCGR